ncbi:MAG TPA: hypothetical protein VM100_07715 [Longimicrobiales bacterium]|nr:hypothetical protein [Longimicrobiales bacterium]
MLLEYEARDYVGVVHRLSAVPRSALLEQPSDAFMLLDAARRVGGLTDLVEFATEVITSARRHHDSRVLCDALNLRGVLLLECGEPQAAERDWCELVALASEADEPQFVARASNNLGVSAILSMRLDDARTSFLRAVGAYLRLGYSRGLAQSHQNLGIVFRELDQERASYSHFQQAMTWAYAADTIDEVARAEEELALMYLYLNRDSATATELAQQALRKFTELGEPLGVAQTLRVAGLIAIARRNIPEAERSLNTALRIATEKKHRLLEAETLLALSAVARLKGQVSIASALENDGKVVFVECHSQRWGEQIGKRVAELG